MVRKIENFVLISAVVALFMVKSSTSNPIENDILEELKLELKSLRVKVDLLEAKNVENEANDLKQEEKIIKLEEKIDVKLISDRLAPASFSDERVIHSTDYEISQVNGKQRPRIDRKAATNELDDSTDNNSRINLISEQEISNKRPTDDSSPRAIAPSSCRELSLLGHSLDGLYLVQNVDTNKIETVLCNFGTSLSQQLIGEVDVRTKSVHFYAQRNTSFNTANAVIPWEVAPLNEGGAMDLISGNFTAPVPGIYHFEFSVIKSYSSDVLVVDLQLNGAKVGYTFVNNQGDTATSDSISLTASLRLKANDRVNLFNSGNGEIFGFGTHCTHFTGWLVEEDLI